QPLRRRPLSRRQVGPTALARLLESWSMTAKIPLPADPPGGWLVKAHTRPADIDAQAWNALLDDCAQPTPFMKHEWLSALHETGCATPDTGWAPLFLTVHAPFSPPGRALSQAAATAATTEPTLGPIEAACALYLKSHSYGEYVFDWA